MTRKPLPWARFTWLAGKDRVGHATSPGLPRTACGLRRLDERFAWPERTRCPECLEALGLDWMAEGA